MSVSQDAPERCAGCDAELSEGPNYFLASEPERVVCSPSCGFDVLACGVVVGEVCVVCGEDYDGGRVPTVDGYEAEMCVSCARNIERRTPRRRSA